MHQPEETFWKTMNPARMVALLEALNPPEEKKEDKKKSLAEYLLGGS